MSNINLTLFNKKLTENSELSFDYEDLDLYKNFYTDISNESVKTAFALCHYKINNSFELVNQSGPSGYFHAASNRYYLETTNNIDELFKRLENSPYTFDLVDSYKNAKEYCDNFIKKFLGSTVPEDFEHISIIDDKKIFIVKDTAIISNKNIFKLKKIGEGSYANVFKYKDPTYKKYFVVKRAKKDLSDKEYKRFKTEYEEMKKLNSPYVVEVYTFNDEKKEYIMEYVDLTLHDYISKNNTTLLFDERKNIILQILRAFSYIHENKLLHRDISLTNILIKKYTNINVVKVSDFGLVKTQHSNLTSLDSELKGSLNDPILEIDGFSNYNIQHEVYALTRLIYFVLTGKTKIILNKIDNPSVVTFVNGGLNNNLKTRYKNILELKNAFLKIHGTF